MKKRLTALFIVLTLLLPCFAAYGNVVLAAVEQTGEINVVHDMSTLENRYNCARSTKSVEYGVGGRSAEDKAVRFDCVTDYSDTSWYGYSYWDATGFGNYLVFEANVYFDENVTGFYIGTRQHNAISATVKKDYDYSANQWGKYVAVLDIEENTTDTYFNGELIDSAYSTRFNTTVDGKFYNDIRLIFNGTTPGSAWISDFKVYEAESEPVISNSLYLEGYEDEAFVLVREGTSFDTAFKPGVSDAQVRIYTDGTYTKTITTEDILTDGCKIVLEHDGEIRTYTVDIDDGINVEDTIDDGTIIFQRAVAETINGAFGKAQDDVSQKIVADSTLATFSTYTWLTDEFEGYVRADFNIEPGDMTSIYIGTNVHKPVSEPLMLNANQWNRVTVVYNTADYDRETGVGKATTYVNGVKLSTVDTIFTNLGQMRVILTGNAGSYAYVDDFKFSTFAYGEPDIPQADVLSDNVEIVNGYVIPGEGMTVAELSAVEPESEVRVFSNSLCTEELTDEDVISLGNTIVVETDENVYNYYTAYDTTNINILRTVNDASDSFAVTRAETEGVKGLGGKDVNDESIKITVTGEGTDANAFNDYTWTNDGYEGYLTAEFNVYPVTAYPSLATNSHSPIASSVSGLVKKRWNKVVMFYDAGSYDGSKGKTYLYVNGEYVGIYDAAFTSGNVIRLIAYSEEDEGGYLYVDDYRIYESDLPPIVSVPDIGSYYSVNEDTVAFEEGTTPLELSAGRLTLRVFEDDTFAVQLGEEDEIVTGNVVVAEDSFKTITYYTVNNTVTKSILAAALDTNIPAELKVIDADISPAYGVHGRDASDESIKLALTYSNGYIQYNYASPSEDRYVVLEASAYTEEDGFYKIGTNGHYSISDNVYIKDESGYKNQWSRVVFIFDKEDGKGSLYVNGDLVNEKTVDIFPSSSHSMLRFIYYGAVGQTVYLDDISIYECNVKPAVANAAVIPASVRYILFNSELYLPSDVRRSQLESVLEIDDEATEINIYKEGAEVEIDSDGALPDDSFMTLKRGDNLYTAYNVHITENNNAFFYGPMGTSKVLSDGVLKIAVPIENVTDQPKVIVAGYKNGELVSIAQPAAEGFSKHITYDIEVVSADCDSIKVMVWDFDSLMPYSKNASISK